MLPTSSEQQATTDRLSPATAPDSATRSPGPQTPPNSGAFRDDRRFRTEIHGVRGLAIAGVVLFHVLGQGRVSGGIDAFLAITGFLAIPSLLRRAQARGGTIDLVQRWAGIARRIIIPLIPLLIVVALAGVLLLPQSRLPGLWGQIRASLLGYENWELISNSLDYNAAGREVSPLQHLWSISIQLQFHLIIPFIVMAVAIPLMARKRNPQLALALTLVLISGLSFTYAAWMQTSAQSINYLSTWSRAWELCLAGAVALAAPYIKLHPSVRAALAWIGLAMLFSTGFIFSGASQFPGPSALWPVLGLLLILVAGESRSRFGPDRLWTLPPVVFLANIAYSLYLWHWPILIFAFSVTGKDRLDWQELVAVIVLSLACAWISYELCEKRAASLPFFHRGNKADLRTVSAALAAIALGAAATVGLQRHSQSQMDDSLQAQREEAQLIEASHTATEDFFPTADMAPKDLESFLSDPNVQSCFPMPRATNEALEPCVGGSDSDNPQATILLTGGSHVAMWWDAFDELGKELDIRVLLLARSACHFSDIDYAPDWFWGLYNDDPSSPDGLCVDWNSQALDRIIEIKPDLVVTLGTSIRTDDERYDPAWGAAWEKLLGADIGVLALRDIPFWEPDQSAVDCVIANTDAVSTCQLPRSRAYNSQWDDVGPTEMPAGVNFLDLAHVMCPDGVSCPAVQPPYLVYRDNHHVTRTFAVGNKELFSNAVTTALEQSPQ